MKLCWFGIHKFDMWKETGSGKINTYGSLNNEKHCIGTFIIQERICKVCNKKQLNTQRTYII